MHWLVSWLMLFFPTSRTPVISQSESDSTIEERQEITCSAVVERKLKNTGMLRSKGAGCALDSFERRVEIGGVTVECEAIPGNGFAGGRS